MLRSTDATYPLVCLQGVGYASEADLAEARLALERTLARSGSFLCITDVRRSSFSAQQRTLFRTFFEEIEARCVGRAACSIVIIESAIARGALLAYSWVVPPRLPQDLVADTVSALEAARKHAEKSGFVVPSETCGRARLWLEEGLSLKTG